MCDTCGCTVTRGRGHIDGRAREAVASADERASVEVLSSLLAANERRAAHNREHFDSHGTFTVNLMSSPGSGKTSLLEATIEALGGRLRIAVIEGDLETENDAVRIRAKGVPAIQITTGSACHLDADMVHDALHELDLDGIDLLFIENVGNLVCPASFDLGQHADVVLLSATEGDDKPAKYPVMFRAADVLLLSKSDLVPLLGDFDPAKAEVHLRELASDAPVLPVSARPGVAMVHPWLAWLEQARRRHLAGRAGGTSRTDRSSDADAVRASEA